MCNRSGRLYIFSYKREILLEMMSHRQKGAMAISFVAGCVAILWKPIKSITVSSVSIQMVSIAML